mgnify:CR=1 FL=1
MQRIKKGDTVEVIAGKDKGFTGDVVSVITKSNRVIVNGVNIAKKHVKANPNENQPGGIVDKEMPIQASNIMLFNPTTDKGDRVGFRDEDGRKVRYFKSNGEVVSV